VNTAAPAPAVSAPVQFPDADTAWGRVLKIQIKLHQWASEDPSRRFDDLFNLVCDPAFLALAWDRVRGNTGPGPPGWTARAPSTSRRSAAVRRSSPSYAPI
jgi:RNA-directed DNA polymerase